MPKGEYGFGVDVGAGTIETAVAVLPPEEAAGLPPAEGGSTGGTLPATFTIDATGRPRLCAPADAGPGEEVLGTAELLDRVGDPTPLRLTRWTGSAAVLLAALVAETAAAVAGERGAAPAWTSLVVPPSWGDHRREALTAALAAAGVDPVSLTSAGVAAVQALTAEGRLTTAAPVLVLDLGSATLDTAVVRADDDCPVHTAVPLPPLAWGGRDADDVVVAHVRDCLDAPGLAPADRAAARALLTACVTAREALSTRTVVDVELGPPWTPPSVRLTREELEERLDEAVDAVADAATDAVTAAGLTAAELGAVVLTGGLAGMPLIAERLSAELAAPLVVADEPGRTAARGAALLAVASLAPAATDDEDTDEDAEEEPTAAAAPRRRPRVRQGARRRDATPERPATAPAGAHPRGRAGDRAGRPWRLRGGLVAGLFLTLVLAPPALLTLTGSSTVGALPGQSAAAAGTPGTTETPAGSPAGAVEQLPAEQVSPAAATASHLGSRTASGTTRAAGRSSDGSTAARPATTARGTTAAGTRAPAPTGATTPAPAPSDLVTAEAPGTTSSPPPVTTPDPPATTPDPPATTPDPPATTPDPPATTPDPPATTPDPPADTPASTPDTGGAGTTADTASGTADTASGTAGPAA